MMQVAEVEADLELIVKNAHMFNRPTDPVFRFATELQTAFRRELPRIYSSAEGEGARKSDVQTDKKPRVR